MFYSIARVVVYAFLHLRFRIRVVGKEHIPDGGCIIAMNHTSNYDPPLIGAHTPRKMYFMAKKELFANRWIGKVLRTLGGFPIDRERADVRSLKHTLRLVKEGKIFSIFIEGTRSKTGEMQIPKKGIGFIASKSKAPVVPAYIYLNKKGWYGRAGIIFGPPLRFDGEKDYEAIAEKVAAAIQKLAAKKDE